MRKEIEYKISPAVDNEEMNELFRVSWSGFESRDFSKILKKSLVFICAYYKKNLIGFVNVAWDGGVHAFLLDATVHPDFRRRGIGTELVRNAVKSLKGKGLEWLHVDYEEHLDLFYKKCGFSPTKAGLINLLDKPEKFIRNNK